jgi:hypothetical protein
LVRIGKRERERERERKWKRKVSGKKRRGKGKSETRLLSQAKGYSTKLLDFTLLTDQEL